MTTSIIPAASASPLRQRLIADMTMRRFSVAYGAGLRASEVASLKARGKVPKPRAKAKLMDDGTVATYVSQIWPMDFVHDQLATGCKPCSSAQ